MHPVHPLSRLVESVGGAAAAFILACFLSPLQLVYFAKSAKAEIYVEEASDEDLTLHYKLCTAAKFDKIEEVQL